MANQFETFVCEKTSEAAKLYVNKLLKKAGKPVEKKISFNEARQWESFEEFLDFVGLPKPPARKIDEEYTPPPTRYIFTSPEIGGLLELAEEIDNKKESVATGFRKFEGTFNYYEIFSVYFFKSEHVLAVEEIDDKEVKILGYYNLKGIFDIGAFLEDLNSVIEKRLDPS